MNHSYCRILLLVTSLFSFTSLNAQSSTREVTISGVVKNGWTGETMSGVSVFITTQKKGTTTDNSGAFEIDVLPGTYFVKFSRVDMKEEEIRIDAVNDIQVTVELKEKVYTLKEVDIMAEKEDANVKNLDIGKNTMLIEKLNSLPTFLGETDVIKSLTLLPGVTTVGEGASGFNVRGGGVDQNLILQDGALIFNPSHVFGFFSSFNPAVVNKATLYKSGLPAKYGGRLSSVLDVEVDEGNFKEFDVSGGIGLVTSRLAIEGPILKDKLSFILSTRLSYSDWLLGLAESENVKNSSAAFQDYNAKLTYRLNTNNKIYYSGYRSHDKFALASDTAFAWTTMNHTLGWIHNFNEAFVLTTTGTSGSYDYLIEDKDGINAFDVRSAIRYSTAKIDAVYDMSRHSVNMGSELVMYDFSPGNQSPLTNESGVKTIDLEKEKSTELSFYAEDEYKITEKLSVRAGLRYSMFRNFGPGTDYLYESNGPKDNENITDTIYYGSGETIANYSGLEPRVNFTYILNPSSSLKASYNRTRQYLHLITNTAAVTPTDTWKTSNKYIEPETGDQYSVGYFRNFMDNLLETSVEVYYKTADNIVDFKDGTVLLMNENIEADLINGTSEAYGMELFLNKKAGKLNGWMSYTYSRIFRTVNGVFEEERISNGQAYPANNDKPHNVTMVANYKGSPVVEYGANFTYSTGRPATVPLTLYDVSNQSHIFNFSKRNQGRIPDYHRLDLSVTVHSKKKIDRRWNISWTFAVYNIYARKNAYSVFYKNEYGNPPKAYKLSVLGSAFPSLMLNFKF